MSSTRQADTFVRPQLRIDLALQGGGSHGAFTWGVLDRLLEESWLLIDGISGTSAGAMNAAVLISGYAAGGATGARAALEAFWRRVSRAALLSPFQRGPLEILLGRWTLDTSPVFIAMDLMARVVSPYSLNPAGVNPLCDVLAQSVDFARLAKAEIKLFVTATNVHTGRGSSVPQSGDYAGGAACLRLPTDTVPRRRDRRPELLGWRLFRQPDHYAAYSRMRVKGYDPRANQSG
jgi:NTE family protein